MLNLILDYPFQYHDENNFYLYRHMSFQDYYLEGLRTSKVYFSSPENFNDPFDSYFSLAEQPSKVFHNTILNNLNKNGSPAQRILQRKTSKYLLEQSFKDGSFFDEHFKKVGVVCFNHNPLNILMWSHYSNNHKGFLVEFKFRKDSKYLGKMNFCPFPVQYVEEYPRGRLHNFDDNEIYKMLYTKANDWSYEKEFRMIADGFESINDISRLYKYSDYSISSIILGCKTLEEDANEIKSIINQNNKINMEQIKVYQAKKYEGKFAITVPSHPRLDVLAKLKKLNSKNVYLQNNGA